MRIFTKIVDIKAEMTQLRSQKMSIGFVPTMGALHKGHISLVLRARKDNAVVVSSIFVNPKQFNNPDDLKKYPRTFETDLEMLKSVENNIVFSPGTEEMYPADETEERFEFDGLDQVMEGKFRPGHFEGVAKVVAKLFRIVGPDNAYFGEKDYQQLLIIKKISAKLFPEMNIMACPTIREPDGLAMSSRNTLLDKASRSEAGLISKALFQSREMKDKLNVREIKKMVEAMINSSASLKVEYFEIADERTLQPIAEINDNARAFIAVKAGTIRLIDNLSLNF